MLQINISEKLCGVVIEVACGEYGDYVPRLAEGVTNGLCEKLDAAFTIAFAHQRYFLSRIDEELSKANCGSLEASSDDCGQDSNMNCDAQSNSTDTHAIGTMDASYSSQTGSHGQGRNGQGKQIVSGHC